MPSLRPDASQNRILEHLKRRGTASVPDLARAFDLSVETVRSQVKALVAAGLVERTGARRARGAGRGRPEQVFGLTERAEALFPSRDGEILRGLATFLQDEGEHELIVRYVERFAKERRQKALERLEGLEGAARLREAARILSEEGYMAEVVEADGRPVLRLCNCPIKDLVEVTSAPCKAEIALVRALVGDTLTRVEYLPDGDGACAYAIGTRPAG